MNIWNKEKFGDIDNNINKLEAKIAALVEKHESKDLDEVDVARLGMSKKPAPTDTRG